ncbi:MAG: RtcB family protein [Chloroflexi bacterium]|nr:RtcB family protein [Chloroflexota bacterium]
MITKHDLERISEFVWQVPRELRADMRVPARMYADEELLDDALQDKSVEQLMNTATLPGIVKYAIAMPDIHLGYGAPVGGVFATATSDGVISPGAVGYDINCGVRVLASQLNAEEIRPHLRDLATELYSNCPSGVGVSGTVNLRAEDLDDILNRGSDWTLERGYALADDLPRTEEYGRIPYADAAQVSHKAKERGRDQLGTLGAGNHFIEVDRITRIYDDAAARVLNLFENQIVVQIHCGSRGLGHQVCQDYVDRFQRVVKEYNIVLPDRELVAAPYKSPEGQEYAAAMGAAANFAFANRQVLAFHIRRSFANVLKGHVRDFALHQVYDIAHNMAKVEDHIIGGEITRVLVHRKGATRAFGPDSPVLPDDLKPIGQPVLIPGSMGTMSFILVGTAGSMAQTFGSSCHGAGRVWSRRRAKKEIRGDKLRAEMEDRGIAVRAGSLSGLAEEAPQAYKDVSRVVQVVDAAGIGKRVARLEPLAVIKG